MNAKLQTLIRTSGSRHWPEPIRSGEPTGGAWYFAVAPLKPFFGVVQAGNKVLCHVSAISMPEDEATANGQRMAASKALTEAVDNALEELAHGRELTVGAVRKLKDAAALAHGRINIRGNHE